jgi:predicted nucleic acid-binding Zn ribbon protein
VEEVSMPVYVYKNLTGETFEFRQSIQEPALTAHPETGEPVRRVVQPVGIAFKGSGFYVTDSRKSGASQKEKTEGKGEGKSEGKTDSSKTDSSKTEGKTEANKTGTSKTEGKAEPSKTGKEASSSGGKKD